MRVESVGRMVVDWGFIGFIFIFRISKLLILLNILIFIFLLSKILLMDIYLVNNITNVCYECA